MEFESKNTKKEKHARRNAVCQICAGPSMYIHYTVRSCEGCKQFFRRIVVGRLDYICQKEGKCKINSVGDRKQMRRCASCRLDTCLLAGMDPMMVETKCDDEWKQFIALMKERKRQLQLEEQAQNEEEAAISPVQEVPIWSISSKQLEADPELGGLYQSLEHTVLAHRHLWRAMFECEVAIGNFVSKFEKFEELIGGQQNVLSMYNGQLEHEPAMLIENDDSPTNTDENGMKKKSRFRIFNIASWLLAIGLVKTMPAFGRLRGEDQCQLVRFLVGPIGCLTIFHYSLQMGQATRTYPDGVHSIGALLARKQFREDSRLHAMAERSFTRPIQRFQQVGLDQQEFGLVMAILCSSFSSLATDLSSNATELLYAQQVHYSEVLLRRAQGKFGPERGAKRYADCLDLVGTAFRSAHTHRTMLVYLGAVHGDKTFQEADLPKCLLPLL